MIIYRCNLDTVTIENEVTESMYREYVEAGSCYRLSGAISTL